MGGEDKDIPNIQCLMCGADIYFPGTDVVGPMNRPCCKESAREYIRLKRERAKRAKANEPKLKPVDWDGELKKLLKVK